ncbi:MAG: prenyltransferase [Deltaproteobacteria bacterium]|nr:prenyltransferase [Deltaproteobacteria bacterium]
MRSTPPPQKAALLALVLAVGGAVAATATLALSEVDAESPHVPSSRSDAEPFRGPGPSQVRAAVAKGLRWLKQAQDPKSGGWIQNVGYKRGDAYVVTTSQQPHVGVSALANMAFLSGGHLPSRGLYGRVVERGVDYVLSRIDSNSGFITGHDTRMYSHAFATLFLAEVYGMTHREDVKERLQLAIDLIVKSQNQLGSWRYRPFSNKADMSITVCQIMALRAARNVGIRVPKQTIDRAHEYVEKSAYKNRRSRDFGGFKYKLESGSRTTFALTAAGIATLNHSGIYDSELIRAGIKFLKGSMSRHNRLHWRHYYYFYGHYYASQVFFLCSDDRNDLWSWYWPRISADLLSHQQPNGSWKNTTGPGAAFSTAVACVVLQIPNEYLPIFHR